MRSQPHKKPLIPISLASKSNSLKANRPSDGLSCKFLHAGTRGRGGVLFAFIVAVLFFVLSFVHTPVAQAATTFTVNTLADNTTNDSFCTLREAIDAANGSQDNANCGSDNGSPYTINFSVSGTIVLGSTLDINTGALTIDGTGQSVTISGNDAVVVFSIGPATVTMNDLTITKGSAGGISNAGTLAITNSTLSDNSAGAEGGGIYNVGILTITNSTLSGNSAGVKGGGIYNGGTLTITNSTLSGNAAGGAGGGIYNATNSTATITNSIVALQTRGGDCAAISPITNGGHNIDSDSSCGFTGLTDHQGVTAGQLDLGGLTDNGGPTQTMALGTGSVAIDAGDNAVCAAPPVNNVDQRGAIRPYNGVCDIGAYEFALPDLTATKTSSGGSQVIINEPFNWIITIQNIGSGIASFSGGQDVLIDELPTTGATYGAALVQDLSGGTTGGVTCAPIGAANPILDCYDSGSLQIPPGGSLQIEIPVTPTAIGKLTNPETRVEGYGCMVNPYLGEVFDESNETNNSCSNTVTVVSASDLSITKTDGVTSLVPGQGVTYTIIVTNNGPSDVTGATVADTMPAALTGVSWSCVAAAGSSCTGSGSGNITDSVNLLSGGTATYTVNATVSASAAGTLSNTATVTVPAGTTDPAPGNNSATDTDTIAAPVAVPALGGWGALVIVVLAGICSVFVLRRRARQSGPTAD